MPDKGSKMIFEAQEQYYPVALFGGRWHFCGIPRVMAWTFNSVIQCDSQLKPWSPAL